MKKNDIFIIREKVGKQILKVIKDKGYTKSSFAKMIEISRPTLNTIIEGKIPSETTFNKHLSKLLYSLNMTLDELMEYREDFRLDGTKVVYSNNSPEDYIMKESAINTLEALDGILDLYEIYL